MAIPFFDLTSLYKRQIFCIIDKISASNTFTIIQIILIEIIVKVLNAHIFFCVFISKGVLIKVIFIHAEGYQ